MAVVTREQLMAAVVAACAFLVLVLTNAEEDTIRYRMEKYVELRYSLQSIANAPNSNAAFILPPLDGFPTSGSIRDANFFGTAGIYDFDLSPLGQESPVLASMKGIGVITSTDTLRPGTELIFTVVFNEASGYGGSTIQYRGFTYLYQQPQELSIAGGTGVFRMARGWAELPAIQVSDFFFLLNLTSYVYYGGY